MDDQKPEQPVCNQRVMIVILFLALAVFWVWGSRPFKDPNLNKIALPFGIVLLFWFFTVFLRWIPTQGSIGPPNSLNQNVKMKTSLDSVKAPTISFDYNFKCFLGQYDCENGDFTLWTVGHFIFYLIVGLYVPNYYLLIFAISVACEMIENGMGFTSKYVLDVGVNLLGYAVGSGLALLWARRKWARGAQRQYY